MNAPRLAEQPRRQQRPTAYRAAEIINHYQRGGLIPRESGRRARQP